MPQIHPRASPKPDFRVEGFEFTADVCAFQLPFNAALAVVDQAVNTDCRTARLAKRRAEPFKSPSSLYSVTAEMKAMPRMACNVRMIGHKCCTCGAHSSKSFSSRSMRIVGIFDLAQSIGEHPNQRNVL